MTVEKTTLVMQFRQEVGRKLNVDSERIRLIFAGRVLTNIETIDKYDIIEGSVIHAVVRPVGAVPSAVPTPAPRPAPRPPLGRQETYIPNSSTSVTGAHTISINANNLPAMFGNMGMGQIIMGMQQGEVPDNVDAILSQIFHSNTESNAANQGPSPSVTRGVPILGNGNPTPILSPANQVTANQHPGTASITPTASRGTILRAHEQFGAVVERGVSSIRCINESLYRNNRDSALPPPLIPDDVDTRAEDPTLAMSQILTELNTSLTGLQLPVSTMATEMQTGTFTSSCVTSTDRINRQSQLTNLKTLMQNLSAAAQNTAKAIQLLTLEVNTY